MSFSPLSKFKGRLIKSLEPAPDKDGKKIETVLQIYFMGDPVKQKDRCKDYNPQATDDELIFSLQEMFYPSDAGYPC